MGYLNAGLRQGDACGRAAAQSLPGRHMIVVVGLILLTLLVLGVRALIRRSRAKARRRAEERAGAAARAARKRAANPRPPIQRVPF